MVKRYVNMSIMIVFEIIRQYPSFPDIVIQMIWDERPLGPIWTHIEALGRVFGRYCLFRGICMWYDNYSDTDIEIRWYRYGIQWYKYGIQWYRYWDTMIQIWDTYRYWDTVIQIWDTDRYWATGIQTDIEIH